MSPNPLLGSSMLVEVALCLGVLSIMWRGGLVHKFSFVAALSAVWGVEIAVSTAMLFFRENLGLSLPVAFNVYFYTFWACNLAAHALMLCVIYQVFRQAMLPFKGLSRFGTMIFKWVCAIALITTAGIALLPRTADGTRYAVAAGQFEQGISILTICLLVFVCFASSYLGMTFRSHIFGISLGLGLQGLASLITSAVVSTHGAQSLYANVNLLPTFGGIAALITWGGYLMVPELERQLVLLPTTSPYFHWNQISEALGDHPGVVAVAGFTPEMLAPAEHTMLEATAQKLRARTAEAMVGIEPINSERPAMAIPR